jgi:hypothetical protein
MRLKPPFGYFSIYEIADALGIKVDSGDGVSYGCIGIHIPLRNGKFLHLRHGDDEESDRECKVVKKYLPV